MNWSSDGFSSYLNTSDYVGKSQQGFNAPLPTIKKKTPTRPKPNGCRDEDLDPRQEEELFWVAGHSIGARRESRLDENAKSTSQSAPQPTPGAIFMVNVNIMRHNGISDNLVAGLGPRSPKPAGPPCRRAAFGPASSRGSR